MRICLTGTQSTGKSTILKELTTKFNFYKFQTEVVRNHKLPLNEGTTNESQMIYFCDILSALLENENLIADRGLIDSLAYTAYSRYKKTISDMIFNVQFKLTRENINKYDLVFYFPIEFPVVKDGFRAEDEDYRKEIDQYVKFYLDQFNVPYITVTGTVEQRVKIIEDAINAR